MRNLIVIPFLIASLSVTADPAVKIGDTFKRCRAENPFEAETCTFTTILAIKDGWVKYELSWEGNNHKSINIDKLDNSFFIYLTENKLEQKGE